MTADLIEVYTIYFKALTINPFICTFPKSSRLGNRPSNSPRFEGQSTEMFNYNSSLCSKSILWRGEGGGGGVLFGTPQGK